MEALAELAARLATAAAEVATARTVADVYARWDGVTDSLKEALPAVACGEGCSACCNSPPLVTAAEWQALYPQLLALPKATQQAIIAMATSQRVIMPQLRKLRRERSTGADRTIKLEVQCPLLVKGRCTVYASRPLICRTYGMAFAPARRTDTGHELWFFGCHLASLHVEAHFSAAEQASFPHLKPYGERITALNAEIQGAVGFLTQWLNFHIEDGAFVPDVRLNPPFS